MLQVYSTPDETGVRDKVYVMTLFVWSLCLQIKNKAISKIYKDLYNCRDNYEL